MYSSHFYLWALEEWCYTSLYLQPLARTLIQGSQVIHGGIFTCFRWVVFSRPQCLPFCGCQQPHSARVCVAGVLQRLSYHEAGRPFRVVHRTVMGVLFPFFLCRCKPRITGQRCDRCAPGFHHFPECVPCSCHRDGTEPDVCDPGTGACVCKVKQVL